MSEKYLATLVVYINSPERKLPSTNQKWTCTNSLKQISSNHSTNKNKNLHFHSSLKLTFNRISITLFRLVLYVASMPLTCFFHQVRNLLLLKTSTHLNNLIIFMRSPVMFHSRCCFSPSFSSQIRLGFNKTVLFLNCDS